MRHLIPTLVAAAMLAGLAGAQNVARGQTYGIPTSTVDCGGFMLAGGKFRLVGTAGQPEQGQTSAAASIRLRTGFWAPLIGEVITSVPDGDDGEQVPSRVHLSGPAPNPFNPRTSLQFELPRQSPVELTIYDVSGRRVADLVSATLPAGRHEVHWDARDGDGQPVSSGIYLAVLRTGSQQRVQRLALVK